MVGIDPITDGTTASQGLHVLIVEDDAEVGEVLATRLRYQGFEAEVVPTAEQGLQALHAHPYGVVLLDLQLPGMSGHEACRAIREQRGDDIPIIFISGSASVDDRLEGFAAGADDYIAKPVDYRELVMRVRAVSRRYQSCEAGAGEYRGPEGLLLDAPSRTVLVHGRPVSLTPTEFMLLRELLQRRGEALAADALSSRVWGYETFGDRNYLEAQVSRLRAKLAATGARAVIETVRGFGYIIR